MAAEEKQIDDDDDDVNATRMAAYAKETKPILAEASFVRTPP